MNLGCMSGTYRYDIRETCWHCSDGSGCVNVIGNSLATTYDRGWTGHPDCKTGMPDL